MSRTKMSGRDIFTLILLVGMSVFLYADQRIVSAILPELSTEYGIGERALGLIGSAFILVGAVVSIFFGYFTDKFSRKKLLILTVIVGELPCLLTGIPALTRSVEAFVVFRILTGIGIGGIYPITFSLISDYFREEHRATASAWVGVAWAIGSMIGPAVAGYLTGTHGWRIAFVLVALPNFPLVIAFALFARDPERGRTEKNLEELIARGIPYKERISFRDFQAILSNKTNIWTFLQGIPGTIPWGILGYWLILFLERERGFNKRAATTVFLFLGVGVTIGSVVFAVIGEKLYRRDPKYMPILCGIGVLVGIVPIIPVINAPLTGSGSPTVYVVYLLAFVAGFFVSVSSANVKAILMNVNPPERRGSVFSIFNITDNLGQGFGPVIGGLLVPVGYIFTMNFAVAWWIPCGLIFFVVARHIGRDRDRLQAYLQNRAGEMTAGKR